MVNNAPHNNNNGVAHDEILITEAPLRGVEIEHPEVEVPDKATPLPEDRSNWELTPWEKLTLTIDDTLKYTNAAMQALPYIVKLFYGGTVKNWKTTLGALIAGLATVLNALGIVDIPAEVQTGIMAVALFIIGLFARDASNKNATEN